MQVPDTHELSTHCQEIVEAILRVARASVKLFEQMSCPTQISQGKQLLDLH